MIDKNDVIYVKINDNYEILGNGFKSKDDVADRIRERYTNTIGNNEHIEFGVCDKFNKISTVEFNNEPEYKGITKMKEKGKNKLNSIVENAESDNRIVDITKYDAERKKNARHLKSAVRYQNTVRYDGIVDFSIKLDNSLFNDLPVGSYDEKPKEKIKSIFSEVAGDKSTYLGFYSTYASRGRRNPFVRVYGRVNRQNNKEIEFREIQKEPFVKGHYWTEENLSPVSIYHLNNTERGDRDQDYIIILDKVCSQTEYENLTNSTMDYVLSKVDHIEENYDYEVDWIGKLCFFKEFNQVCIGISYVS